MVGAVAGLMAGFLAFVVIPLVVAGLAYGFTMSFSEATVEGGVFVAALTFIAWDIAMIVAVKEAHVS